MEKVENLILRFEGLNGAGRVDLVREVMGEVLADPEGSEVYTAFGRWVEENHPIIWEISKFNENDI